MADEGMLWIYLIFFMIPLIRILPRLIRKFRGSQVIEDGQGHSGEEYERSQNTESFESQQSAGSFERPQSAEMRVLGEISRGVKSFGGIQKNLGMNSQELEGILKGLEDEGEVRVVTKGGLFGTKVELRSTEKGRKRFYS